MKTTSHHAATPVAEARSRLPAAAQRELLWMLLVAIAGTLPFWLTDLDIKLQQAFFRPELQKNWPLAEQFPWRQLYLYGTWPAILVVLGALLYLATAPLRHSPPRFKWIALFLVLTMLMGPGLLTNAMFKDHWGRPRPSQTTTFGGTWPARPVWQKGPSGQGKSFPCGHATMGFFFLTFYYLFHHRPVWRRTAVAAALTFGTLIGIARMAAGGHFASDVLWAALFTWFAAWLNWYVLLRVPARLAYPQVQRISRPQTVLFSLIILLTGGILLYTIPTYRDFEYQLECSTRCSQQSLTAFTVRMDCADLILSFPQDATAISLYGTVQGFGRPKSNIRHSLTPQTKAPGGYVFHLRTEGAFTDIHGTVNVSIPDQSGLHVTISNQTGRIILRNTPRHLTNLTLLQ